MDALAAPLCPCCLRPLGKRLSARQLPFLARPANATIARPVLQLLARAWPRPVPLAYLVEHAYAMRPDGGPESAAKCVQVTISRLRRQLAPYGWTISDAWGSGAYRLERIRAS